MNPRRSSEDAKQSFPLVVNGDRYDVDADADTPLLIMAVAALPEKIPDPSDAQIDRRITKLGRRGTFPRIRRAIHRAARASAKRPMEGAGASKEGESAPV
ncbi:MAG: hypothetical protein OEM49_13445 [Myxococcales bacterium]|nr:hypothetical protein [Myxococcales bacterium]